MLSYFRWPVLSETKIRIKLGDIQKIAPQVIGLKTEFRFYVDVREPLDEKENSRLNFFLAETFQPQQFGEESFFSDNGNVVEVGMREGTVTPWSSSAGDIFSACRLEKVKRIEVFQRFHLATSDGRAIERALLEKIRGLLFDHMVEQIYETPLQTFDSGKVPESVQQIRLLEEGPEALKKFAARYHLKFNEKILNYIASYFVNDLRRNPTDVEIYKFGQLNSDHCRHLRFNAKQFIDNKEMPMTLMEMIKDTFRKSQGDCEVAFKDNAAILKPIPVKVLVPARPGEVSNFVIVTVYRGKVFKIETHNHPTVIAPEQGAGTGVAVERDVFGSGRGAVSVDQLACYYVGNLLIPGYNLPWEKLYVKPSGRFAAPLSIIVQASNGASRDCNCKGKPITLGATRSFDEIVDGVHYGYHKTVMVAGCSGYIDASHIEKRNPEKGMKMVELGGPALPIGLGGGSGSSNNAGAQSIANDYNSVQRFNPFVERLNFTVFRACSELGDKNPIETCTDLGAGGNGVAPPELVFPAGAKVYLRRISCGDKTMTVLVYLNNEAQERMLVLVRPENLALFESICARFRCPMFVIGEVTGDGRYVVEDEAAAPEAPREQKTPVDVSMNWLLADLPQEEVRCLTVPRRLYPPQIPNISLHDHLDRVLRLLDVCSKEFLTRKGDRTVGNRSVCQQEVGPLQLPLADCSVSADSMFGKTGMIKAIGEQPIIGLVNNEAGVRMSVGEAMTNAVWALVEDHTKLSFSATWQWACGQPGEDARLYYAVRAAQVCLIKLMSRIGVGKDSVSMSLIETTPEGNHLIIAPGTVQMAAFGNCVDIDNIITPDFKMPGQSQVMFIDLGLGRQRMGGSALLRVHNQLGDEAPDMDNPEIFAKAFDAVQQLIRRKLILSGHDRSDGGMIGTVLEMAFGGNCGLELDLRSRKLGGDDWVKLLLNQELGVFVEFLPKHLDAIRSTLYRAGLGPYTHVIGKTLEQDLIKVRYDGKSILEEPMTDLMAIWRETSFRLDADPHQSTPEAVEAWRKNTRKRSGPHYYLTYEPKPTPRSIMINTGKKAPVAVLCEAGGNGDRDMTEYAYLAGLEPYDVQMTDLIAGRTTLKKYKGVLPVGGFSWKDTFGAGKSEAGVFMFNDRARDEFMDFVERPDTFMVGPCNGCQFMPFLGILPYPGISLEKIPRFIINAHERFETQLVSMMIGQNNSPLLRGMAGSVFGIMVAHGEGRFHCQDEGIMGDILSNDLAPFRYVDDNGKIAEAALYPFNPNGSPYGIAGLVSKNGRFMAMMPHLERFAQLRLLTYRPQEWKHLKASPTLQILQNAREFCEQS